MITDSVRPAAPMTEGSMWHTFEYAVEYVYIAKWNAVSWQSSCLHMNVTCHLHVAID